MPFPSKAGSTVTIQNADGQTLYTATAVASVPNVIFTSADVTEGETYTLLVDGEVAAEAEAVLGTATSSMPQGQPTSTFQDVSSDDWFAQAVAYVSSEGLMSGESTNTFAPKRFNDARHAGNCFISSVWAAGNHRTDHLC